MTTEILWESEPVKGSQDYARLCRMTETGRFAMMVTDCGRPKVVLLSNEDVGRLVYAMMDYAFGVLDSFVEEKTKEEDEPYEKSEKDAMWE